MASTDHQPAYNLSPSSISRYFYQECERHLHFNATPPALRKTHGVLKPEVTGSLATEMVLRRGYDWEEEVIGKLLAGQVQVAPGHEDGVLPLGPNPDAMPVQLHKANLAQLIGVFFLKEQQYCWILQ